MTEALEGVSIGMEPVTKDKCPICEKAPHPERTTTDKKQRKGCLKSIPANLGCPTLPSVPGLPNYTTAAHHLIPANQCLKPFGRLSQMADAVGYDVNNGANGQSLPTCGQQTLNAYSSSTGGLAKYGDLIEADKRDAAYAIMDGLGLQWHVGHHDWVHDTSDIMHVDNYDKLVKTKLRALEQRLAKKGKNICEPEDGTESGQAVISSLNALSAEIRVGVLSWKLYFVSAKACSYAARTCP